MKKREIEKIEVQENSYKEFYNLRNEIFNTKRQHVRNFYMFRKDPMVWFNEFGSVNLNLGRRTGNTTWMIDKVAELAEKDPVLIVFHNFNFQERWKKAYEKINGPVPTNVSFCMYSQNEDMLRGLNPEFIFIDQYEWGYSNRFLNLLKRTFNPELFVLM